jgi:hypothetical protein
MRSETQEAVDTAIQIVSDEVKLGRISEAECTEIATQFEQLAYRAQAIREEFNAQVEES